MSDPLSATDQALKRTLDIVLASLLLAALGPLIIICIIISTFDTRSCGLFRQRRIGRWGATFTLLKIRTMRRRRINPTELGTITTADNERITTVGRVLRSLKIDELPQLWNVLIGEMSLVGPRPDVAGYADRLTGADRIILAVRPGITGPASLAFRDEERLLAAVRSPEVYNDEILFPVKTAMNRKYIENYSIIKDIGYLVGTIVPPLCTVQKPPFPSREVS